MLPTGQGHPIRFLQQTGILEKGSDVDLLVVKDTNRRLIDRLIEVESLPRIECYP